MKETNAHRLNTLESRQAKLEYVLGELIKVLAKPKTSSMEISDGVKEMQVSK